MDKSKPQTSSQSAELSSSDQGEKPGQTQEIRAGETSRVSDSLPSDLGAVRGLPTEFGRYRIEKFLGSGAMGDVYLAEDTKLERLVALKVPRISKSESDSQLRRMETEAKSLAKIDHPQICKVFDFDDYAGIRFIAMEYIPGEDLQAILKKIGRKRKPREAAQITAQLARALETAHDSGVIHRDLKPANIRRRENGRLTIMDFGLARQIQVSAHAERTQGGTILGSAAYMSPEQAGGRIDEIDQRSDIYALGVMLFEMLTGEWPFQGTAIEIMGRKAILDPPDPLMLAPEVPPRLAEICLKMIARSKDERYPNCQALLADLKNVDLKSRQAAGSKTPSAASPTAETADTAVQSVVEPGQKVAVTLDFLKDAADAAAASAPIFKPILPSAVDRQVSTTGFGRASGGWWPPSAKYLGIGGLAAGILIAAILFFQTEQGVLRIEIEDPSLKVNFDGQSLTINNDGQPIRVSPTKAHTLEVQQNGTTLDGGSRQITLQKGEQKLVKISLIDGQVTIDEKPLTQGPPARVSPDLASSPPAAGEERVGLSSATASQPGDRSSTSAVPFRAGEVREFSDIGIKFCWCPPGSFTMGSPASDNFSQADERPQLSVTVTDGFWIARTETTQSQWQQIMGTSPWAGKHHYQVGANYPATFVDWDDVTAYCRKLTDRERRAGRLPADQSYRLPTEAEWEYACRAGTSTRYSFGDDSAQLGRYAWFRQNAYDIASQRFAHLVASKAPNPWGIYDLYGNVSEWCGDRFTSELITESHPVPAGAEMGLIRGGSYFTEDRHCRSASRTAYPLRNGRFNDGIGFRVVRAADQTTNAVAVSPAAAVEATPSTSPPAAPAEPNFVSLFNGKDLTGWQGAMGEFEVQNGILRCRGSGTGTLFTNKSYHNFVARVQYRLTPGSNNGLAIRFPGGEGTPSHEGMCEVQIFDDTQPNLQPEPRQKNGSIYGMVAASKSAGRPVGEWNDLEVRVVGTRIQVKLNAQPIANADLNEVNSFMGAKPYIGRSRQFGYFGFCGNRGVVEFRNIEIAELSGEDDILNSFPVLPSGATTGQMPAQASAVPPSQKATSKADEGRPGDAVLFRGKYYKVFETELTWHEAKQFCEQRGGQLAVVTSPILNHFLYGLVKKSNVVEVWLGATDERQEGNWVWVSGQKMTYRNWAKQQPNNKLKGEHYLVMVLSQNGGWADQPDKSVQHHPGFVCEWK